MLLYSDDEIFIVKVSNDTHLVCVVLRFNKSCIQSE